MIIAENKQNKKRYVSYQKDNQGFILKNRKGFICPNCKQEVLFVNSELKIKHFRHNKRSSCEFEPETQRHIEMKKSVIEILGLNDLKCLEINLGFAIPDIYIKFYKYDLKAEINKIKVAIECQASPITISNFMKRTINYSKNNIYVIWLFDYTLLKERKNIRLFNSLLNFDFGSIYFLRDKQILKNCFKRVDNYSGKLKEVFEEIMPQKQTLFKKELCISCDYPSVFFREYNKDLESLNNLIKTAHFSEGINFKP